MAAGTRTSFFPKADAAVIRTQYEPPSPTSRPSEVAPILDPAWANTALDSWSADIARKVYPEPTDVFSPAPIPDDNLASSCIADRYLFPRLTRNERLRLTMLFYYTRDAIHDKELVSRLQEKVYLARETVGWEFAIAGLLNHNTYTRLVTAGLPLAVLPRRESTCAHTVHQPPGVSRSSTFLHHTMLILSRESLTCLIWPKTGGSKSLLMLSKADYVSLFRILPRCKPYSLYTTCRCIRRSTITV